MFHGYLWICIRPGGYSDLILLSNLYFALAGPHEIHLSADKEFDQIRFSDELKPEFRGISFATSQLDVLFSSSKGFSVQLASCTLEQILFLNPSPLPLLTILHDIKNLVKYTYKYRNMYKYV